MFVHMDGARLANAAAALNQSLRQATRDLGVDILSFGGTKNGLMGGEAVVFFNRELAHNFKFIRKQGMQLASKMRFIAVQFETLLSGDLWLRSACRANSMAKLLEAEIRKIPQLKIVYPVEANGVFVKLPREAIARIREQYFFYVWNEENSVVRWMCSFDTTEEDIRKFAAFVSECVNR
jgi:threonine aldolase